MSACKISKFWVAVTIAALTGAMVQAQEKKIEDQDLLNLLNKVNQSEQNANKAGAASDSKVSQAATEKNPVQEEMQEDKNIADASKVVEEIDGKPAAANNQTNSAPHEMPPVASDHAKSMPHKTVDDLNMKSGGDNAVGSSTENLISVRLNKVGLEEAINLFAQLSGANIIVPELEEKAKISVNLKNVEWRSALQSILATYNYELYQRVAGSNVYSVRRRPAGAPEPQVVQTFTLKYATVPNAAALIRKLLPASATVSEFASRNMLVVKSTESSLGEVRAVLNSIDTVRQQVYIESKFMELSADAQKDLGIDWAALQNYSAGTSGATSKSYNHTHTSTKTGNSFLDANGQPYEDASSYTDYGQRLPGSGLHTLSGVTPTLQNATSKATSDILTSVLSADEFRLVLSALQQNTGVNIVSNPKIIVANEEPANISIVRKEPNLKQERQQALNNTPDTITYALDPKQPFFEYGIKLDVVPSINTSSNITVQINPSLTRKYADKQAGNNTYPIIDEKSIKTIFNLSDGQTAAIGGLTEVTDKQEEHKVPLLGSIPLLGRLFSWSQTVHNQDETIIFVTVGLANTQQLTTDTGMPNDSELARRRIIKDRNSRILRDQDRKYYKAEQKDKLDDMLQVIKSKEEQRVEKREQSLEKKKGDTPSDGQDAAKQVAALN